MALFGYIEPNVQPTVGCAYVARIAFEYGPHCFIAGDDVSLAKLGITESQAVDLWIAGRLLVKSKAQPPKKKAV